MNRREFLWAGIGLAALPRIASAQKAVFTNTYEATKSAAAGVTTLQQPSSPTKNIRLAAVQIYCSVACTVSFEAAGAATATLSTATANTQPKSTTAATALVYHDSDAAAPSAPISKIVMPAGDTKTLRFNIVPNVDSTGAIPKAAGANYTVRTSSITGDVKVTWFWWED
jgi:hypothetical protein